MIKITILILLLMLIVSCSQHLQSRDFTKEGSFTDGIEGPATDYKGNIYAVNFEEQGTIGKITHNGEFSVYKTPKWKYRKWHTIWRKESNVCCRLCKS